MHVCFDVGLGREGSGLGLLFFLSVLCVGWGWDLFAKMPCDLRCPFSVVHVVTSA